MRYVFGYSAWYGFAPVLDSFVEERLKELDRAASVD